MGNNIKKLVGEIKSDYNLEDNIKEYTKILGEKYNYYSLVKASMNYYTMKEIILEMTDKNTDVCKYFSIITRLIGNNIIDRQPVDDEAMTAIKQVRENIEYKMKILTAYTDAFEIYEYVLNRVEAGIKDTVEEVDIDLLSDKMFQYVFSENDKVVINSKLQLLMAQLPIRMTKNKFYDVIANTLLLYKGSDASSLDEFADMIRTSALITKPKGFETEYPFLYHVYNDLKAADYKELSEAAFDDLQIRLSQAADIINEEASNYLLLQEIVNDLYTLLLTIDNQYDSNINYPAYKAAIDIIKICIASDNIEDFTDVIMDNFVSIEGVQEKAAEDIMQLESAFDTISTGKSDKISEYSLDGEFEKLDIISKLLSSSLFIDIDKDNKKEEKVVDDKYIENIKNELTEEFAKIFADNSKLVNRSIMCKIIAAMPVFLNSKQEIKDYFNYTLSGCKDKSELWACNKLICELIEEDY
ncbi:MAG: hypothetical protein IJ053_05740 [Lachnospiraceae bacterium]|nr:hypothetical protein [Lachnospiraceae bacterium]